MKKLMLVICILFVGCSQPRFEIEQYECVYTGYGSIGWANIETFVYFYEGFNSPPPNLIRIWIYEVDIRIKNANDIAPIDSVKRVHLKIAKAKIREYAEFHNLDSTNIYYR